MLAIITTHPIQYQTPIWQALAQDGRVPFEVWFLTDFGTRPSRDPQFGQTFSWDIDLLSGYPHRLLQTAQGAQPADFWRCRVTEDLVQRLRAAGAKAVWIQGWQVAGYWQAAWAAEANGTRLWIRAESNNLARRPTWKRLARDVALGQLFSKVDRFFYIGSANRRLYRDAGVPESALSLAPYAVDNARFACQANMLRGERAALRRAWNIPEDAFCVLFCGKLIPKKRPLDLVMAAQRIARDSRAGGLHLLFAGSGELGKVLREACDVRFDAEGSATATAESEQASRPAASFAGFLNQTQVSRAYVAADCLVLPSDYGETWGLVVNEALASGLPCIVSDACGCAEDLIDPAWIFALGDVSGLADRLDAMRQLGGRPSLRTPPSLSRTIDAVVAAYSQIEQGQGGRSSRRLRRGGPTR